MVLCVLNHEDRGSRRARWGGVARARRSPSKRSTAAAPHALPPCASLAACFLDASTQRKERSAGSRRCTSTRCTGSSRSTTSPSRFVSRRRSNRLARSRAARAARQPRRRIRRPGGRALTHKLTDQGVRCTAAARARAGDRHAGIPAAARPQADGQQLLRLRRRVPQPLRAQRGYETRGIKGVPRERGRLDVPRPLGFGGERGDGPRLASPPPSAPAGVYHLANEFIGGLQAKQPELEITDHEVAAVVRLRRPEQERGGAQASLSPTLRVLGLLRSVWRASATTSATALSPTSSTTSSFRASGAVSRSGRRGEWNDPFARDSGFTSFFALVRAQTRHDLDARGDVHETD